MATNKRFGKNLPSWARREDTVGIRIDSGPFIGIVKDNNDPVRKGRLKIWIPDLGGEETDPKFWRTVGYASPFAGTTTQTDDTNNKFDSVTHSYGMWAVPPDIDCQVLCTFVAGDPDRGFWFACVNPNLSHYMVPAVGSSNRIDNDKTNSSIKKSYDENASNWPVVEFNENVEENSGPGFIITKKPVHETQTKILLDQGLDRDVIRGAPTSSSQRESPSTVFGISTPGRPYKTQDRDANGVARVTAREGGHTFVMDDGDIDGASQLIRLRSAGGHQILLNDSDNVMYISNDTGSTWLEFTSGGHINVYAKDGINMRTEGEFNIHADQDINLNSNANINLHATKGIAQQTDTHTTKASTITAQAGTIGHLSTGELKLQGASGSFKTTGDLVYKAGKIYLNTQAPASIEPIANLKTYSHPDTSFEANGQWVSKDRVFESIATVAPGHEPWNRKSAATGTSLFSISAPIAKQSSVCGEGETSKDPGPVSAKGQQVKYPATVAMLSATNAPKPSAITAASSVPGLLASQVKALMVQIGYAESGHFTTSARIDYSKVDNVRNRIGGYQINGNLLKDYGYITDASNIFSTLVWTGKDGIKSHNDWLIHESVQESVMEAILNDYYNTMTTQQGIAIGDDICIVAGMLSVAYFFRDSTMGLTSGNPPTQAKFWRKQATQVDGTGVPGSVPYNWGRYAIDVLCAPPSTLVTGPSHSGIGPESVINFQLSGSGDLKHYNLLGSDIKTAFEQMAKEFMAKTGRKIMLSSAVRTFEEQTAIYNGWLAAGGSSKNRTVNVPGYGNISMPARPSSNSPHIKGVAFDIAKADIQTLISTGLLDKYSFNFPFPQNDPVHIQYIA